MRRACNWMRFLIVVCFLLLPPCHVICLVRQQEINRIVLPVPKHYQSWLRKDNRDSSIAAISSIVPVSLCHGNRYANNTSIWVSSRGYSILESDPSVQWNDFYEIFRVTDEANMFLIHRFPGLECRITNPIVPLIPTEWRDPQQIVVSNFIFHRCRLRQPQDKLDFIYSFLFYVRT